MMLNLMRAEWLKLTRRPMTWLLLGIFLLLMALTFGAMFFAVALHDGVFGGVRIEILDTLVEQFRQELRFPGVFGSVLGQINSFGGICAIILAAGTLGSEYSWGTLRVQLARHPHRGRYLQAKLLVLHIILFLGMAIALCVGSLLVLLFSSILGNLGQITLSDLVGLPLGMLRALYVFLPYVMCVVAMCAIGRSVFAGVAGGLVFLFLDNGTATLSFLTALDNPFITFLVNLTLQQNINTLVLLNRSTYGFDLSLVRGVNLASLPSPLHATFVIGLYSLLFFGYTYHRLVQRDIGGAT